MSKFTYQTSVSETIFDSEGRSIADHDVNLPHENIISKTLCDNWNKMNMEQYYDGILKDNIVSAVMKPKNENGELILNITFTLKKGVRLTHKYRDAIIDQTSAQMTDGWGESNLGYNNIMTAPDGTRFCAY